MQLLFLHRARGVLGARGGHITTNRCSLLEAVGASNRLLTFTTFWLATLLILLILLIVLLTEDPPGECVYEMWNYQHHYVRYYYDPFCWRIPHGPGLGRWHELQL